MKVTSATLALLLGFAGAASLAEQSPATAERAVAQRTGKQVQWQREQAARDESQRAARALLRRTLTADTAARIALLNNRSLQATFEDIGVSQADLIEAGLLKNPTLDGYIRFPDRPPSAANIEGSIAQDFIDLLLIPLRRRVAQAQLRQTQLRVADAVIKLIADTKVAFYEVQASQQLLARLRLIRETAMAAIDMAQRQHEAGNINDLELANQQASYSQARLDVATAEADLREKRERLNRSMGVWGADTDWKIGDELPPVRTADVATEGLETLAIEERFDIAAAKSELTSVVQALGLTKTYRFIGALEFGVSSERDTDRQVVTGPTVRLELPIFNRGQARIARGEAQLRQAERRLEALAVEVRSEVREKRDRLISSRDMALFYHDELLPNRIRILNLTLLQYNGMFIGVYDLLRAKQEELNAERGYVEALRSYWTTRAELERAVGGSLSHRQTSAVMVQSSAKEIKSPAQGRAGSAAGHPH